MVEDHTTLLGLSDRELLMRAGDATHQHFKGGLYRLVGMLRDADTGDFVRGADGEPRVLYEHAYPHGRAFWLRDHSDFFGRVDAIKVHGDWPYDGHGYPRFRELAKGA